MNLLWGASVFDVGAISINRLKWDESGVHRLQEDELKEVWLWLPPNRARESDPRYSGVPGVQEHSAYGEVHGGEPQVV